LYDSFAQQYVTKALVDEVFGRLASSGGWRPSLMPEYIRLVMESVVLRFSGEWEYNEMKKSVIRVMKRLDPILFRSC